MAKDEAKQELSPAEIAAAEAKKKRDIWLTKKEEERQTLIKPVEMAFGKGAVIEMSDIYNKPGNYHWNIWSSSGAKNRHTQSHVPHLSMTKREADKALPIIANARDGMESIREMEKFIREQMEEINQTVTAGAFNFIHSEMQQPYDPPVSSK